MFKQDDYIVCLKGDFTIGRFESSIARTNGDFTFDKSRKLTDWRYATPEEVKYYEILGKPYDVTTAEFYTFKPEDISYLIEIFAKNNIT